MASINKIKSGQVLFDKHKHRAGHTTIMIEDVWPVYVVSVHKEEGYVIASWNGNKPEKFYENRIKGLYVKKPKFKKNFLTNL